MKPLFALIALRCSDLQTLQQLEVDDVEMEKKRGHMIRLKKAEVRWLIKQHTRFNVEVDFGASNEHQVKVDIPVEGRSVTFIASFLTPFKTHFQLKGKGKSEVSLIDVCVDFGKLVPEGVPDNLVEV